MEKHSPSRRTVVKGAAWAVPAVTIAAAAPALAASGDDPFVEAVNAARPGQPTNAPLVVTDREGLPYDIGAITNVAGLPSDLQLVRKEDGSYAVIGTVAEDYVGPKTVPVTAVITDKDGVNHDVEFNVVIADVVDFCDGLTTNWTDLYPEGFGVHVGEVFNIRTESALGVSNDVPLKVTPPAGVGNTDKVQTVTVEGLPDAIVFDAEAMTLKSDGQLTAESIGRYQVSIKVVTEKGRTCEVPWVIAVEPVSSRISITEDWGVTLPGQANIIGVHFTNGTDQTLCGSDFKMRVNIKLEKGVARMPTMIDTPLSSINLRSKPTFARRMGMKELAVGDQYIMIHKGKPGGSADRLPTEPAEWDSSEPSLLGTGRRPTYYQHDEKNTLVPGYEPGEGFWELKMEEGACIEPGETVHLAIGQPLSAFTWSITSVDVTTPYGTFSQSSEGNTRLHSNWDNELAPITRPGTNGRF